MTTKLLYASTSVQNSENIRTTQQLTPLIFLHLLSGLSLCSLFVAEYFEMSLQQRFMQLTVVNLTNCFLYIACQLAVL